MATEAGVYVHVPFCRYHCPYCDFNVLTGADGAFMQRYAQALRADLEAVGAAGPAAQAPPGADVDGDWPNFGTVFVGGGTPTLLDASDLASVLRQIGDLLPVAADAEVSVEANPEALDADYLAVLVDAGMTRLSIGAQSFRPDVLAALGRDHDVEAPLRAVQAARAAGVAQVSLDLIYGTPGESDTDWLASLDAAVAAAPDHVSAYALTLEPNTVYAAQVRAGSARAPDEEVQAARMAAAAARLAAAGYERYEVSNWARPGARCRHNLNYWNGGDWLGIGAGAHGHWRGRRFWRVRPTARYVQRVLAGADPVSGSEVPDADARRSERLMTGLRLVEGVPRTSVEPLDDRLVAALADAGLIAPDSERLRLTDAGLAVADGITLRLAG